MCDLADMAHVKKMIEKNPNWRSLLIKRHHKFVDNWISHNYDITKTAFDFYFTKTDMLSIFYRIEKQLSGICLREIFVECEAEKVNTQNDFVDVQNDDIRKTLQIAVAEASVFENLNEIFSPRLAETMALLIEKRNLEVVANELKISRRHLVNQIVGRRHPRKPYEKGVMFFLLDPKTADAKKKKVLVKKQINAS